MALEFFCYCYRVINSRINELGQGLLRTATGVDMLLPMMFAAYASADIKLLMFV